MFACIYIPDFGVQAVTRGEPAPRDRAIAVTEGVHPSCMVVALNEKARCAGVQTGMTQLQAAQVAPVEMRRRSPAREAAAHAALLDLGFAFSPRVEDTAADTVVLDLAGLESLWGSAEKIARGLAERAAELGFEAGVALARNPGVAECAARGFAGITIISAGEEAARLAPLPVEVLAPPPEMLETLHRWGVHTFRAFAALPTAQLSERLGQEGVRLQALARGAASRALVPVQPVLHFEEALELEYAVAELDPLAFILGRLLNQLCARLTARGLATNELQLQLGLEADAEKLEIRNSERGIRSSKLEVGNSTPETRNSELEADQSKIQNSKSKIEEPRTLRLPVPTRDSKLLLKLWLLNLQSAPPQAPVLKVAITAEPAQPRVAQAELFLPLAPDPEKLELTLARIARLVGKGKAGSPELVDTHRPDTFQIGRFTGGREAGTGKRKDRTRNAESGIRQTLRDVRSRRQTEKSVPFAELRAGSSLRCAKFTLGRSEGLRMTCRTELPESRLSGLEPRPRMALRIFRPPLPATVEVRNGCPVRVDSSAGVQGEVVSVAGPWRTSGGWWTEKGWQHDEWDVEIAAVSSQPSVASYGTPRVYKRTLSLYCIYQDLASETWFVRGSYD